MLFDYDENGIGSANVREICEFLFRSGDAYTGSASLPLEKMKKDIESYHLILEQIDIREVYYNDDYETAINQKKLEEQKEKMQREERRGTQDVRVDEGNAEEGA